MVVTHERYSKLLHDKDKIELLNITMYIGRAPDFLEVGHTATLPNLLTTINKNEIISIDTLPQEHRFKPREENFKYKTMHPNSTFTKQGIASENDFQGWSVLDHARLP